MYMFAFLLPGAAAVLVAYTFFKARSIRFKYQPAGAFQAADGTRLHYHRLRGGKEGGKSPTLVFIHGASGNALDQAVAFQESFSDRYDLLFIDRPGFGYSGRDMSRHDDPGEQARSIGGLLDCLQIKGCLVVGHSLGAAVAAALAMQRPDKVQGVLFLAPATHPWPGGVNWYYRLAALPVLGPVFCWTVTLPIAERLAPKAIEGVFAPETAADDYVERIKLPLLFRPASFRANACDVANLKRHLTRQSQDYSCIEQPAVVVTGTKDTVVWPSIHSDGLIRDLPNARLVVLEGAGHMPHHTRTAEVVREIESLLTEVSGGDLENTKTPECL